MSSELHTIAVVMALVCLLLAAWGLPKGSRVAMGWLGMFFWVLSQVKW